MQAIVDNFVDFCVRKAAFAVFLGFKKNIEARKTGVPGFVVFSDPVLVELGAFGFAQIGNAFLFAVEPRGKEIVDFVDGIDAGVGEVLKDRSDQFVGQVHRPFHKPAVDLRIRSDVLRIQAAGLCVLVAINEAHFELRQVALAADVGGRGFVSFDGKLVFSLHLSDFVGVGSGVGKRNKKTQRECGKAGFLQHGRQWGTESRSADYGNPKTSRSLTRSLHWTNVARADKTDYGIFRSLTIGFSHSER